MSSNDDSPGDEAQTETPPWEVSDETEVKNTDTNEKAKVITVGAEGKVVVTLKGGSGYDEPWVVIHADDLQDALKQTTDYETLGAIMDAAQKASKKFREFRPSDPTPNSASASQNGSQGRTSGKPASATDGPLGVQMCQHGKKKFWSKFDQEKNELVQIYFCPAQQGDSTKCKNQYVK